MNFNPINSREGELYNLYSISDVDASVYMFHGNTQLRPFVTLFRYSHLVKHMILGLDRISQIISGDFVVFEKTSFYHCSDNFFTLISGFNFWTRIS